MKKETRICPTCMRPFNSSTEALNLLLDKAFPRVMIEVEEKPERIEKVELARVQKRPVIQKKPEPPEDVETEEEEYEDLRLD